MMVATGQYDFHSSCGVNALSLKTKPILGLANFSFLLNLTRV